MTRETNELGTQRKGESVLKISRTYLVALLSLAALAVTGTALAAHNGNNKAELSGVGTGTAVVNYSEGQGTFNGTVTVSGLAANTDYSFFVTGAAAGATGLLICSGTSDSSGTFTCSEQKLGLPGFTTAQVRTTIGGTVVASGTFERRGNCRDPEQAGSQCQAQN